MIKFAKVGEHEANSINFLKEWRPFFQTLTDSEKKVAIKAWFNTIFETLDILGKDIDDVVKNGNEEDIEFYRNAMKDFHKHPFFDKNRTPLV